jgi:hypothetical protein
VAPCDTPHGRAQSTRPRESPCIRAHNVALLGKNLTPSLQGRSNLLVLREKRHILRAPRAGRTERNSPSQLASSPGTSTIKTPSSFAGATSKLNIIRLVVLGDVAVRHPPAGVGDVEEDVDGLASPHQHGVLPDGVLLGRPVPWPVLSRWQGPT